jgi:hypothetical protein
MAYLRAGRSCGEDLADELGVASEDQARSRELGPLLRNGQSFERVSLQFQNGFAAGPVEEIRSRGLQSKRRASCRRKSDLFAQLSLVLQCFAQCPYRWNVRQHRASWCLLVRHKPTMVTIDVSLDELTGATIIITATTDRL